MARSRPRLASVAVLTGALVCGLAVAPAGAVHESYHGPFLGETSQGKGFFMQTPSHTRVGIRVRWRADCESGSITRTTRFRKVAVSSEGRFFRRRNGVGVRGKIGFGPQGNPVFPEPFSFANNEAKGRLRAVVDHPEKGHCRSGLVTWQASR